MDIDWLMCGYSISNILFQDATFSQEVQVAETENLFQVASLVSVLKINIGQF